MFYEKPTPFYMAYPVPEFFDQEWEQERDLRIMKSYYSGRTARIQELAEQECDRMEYDGSMMFDDYPDKFTMRRICRRIEDKLEGEWKPEAGQRKDELEDLIGVLLCSEMYRRRCRRRKYRRFF